MTLCLKKTIFLKSIEGLETNFNRITVLLKHENLQYHNYSKRGCDG